VSGGVPSQRLSSDWRSKINGDADGTRCRLVALQRHHATAQGWRLSDLKQKLPTSVLVYEFTA